MQLDNESNEVTAKFLYSVPVANQLGEGVIWDTLSQQVWWTDIEGKMLYAFEPQSHKLSQWHMPERLCSFALTETKGLILAAFASGFALYRFEGKGPEIEWLARPELSLQENRMNDGRVDAKGRFWCGSMVEEETAQGDTGSLYCINKGQCQWQGDGYQILNGLAWSLDNRWLYCADSAKNRIYRHSFDAKEASLGPVETFATTAEHIHPDGSTVDSDGSLWSAQWGGGRVVRYSVDGDIQFILKLPVSQPSCVAFGGEQMNLLFVTTAREGLSSQQLNSQALAGDLLVYQLRGVRGLPTPHYQL
ncbi:SMP-30/gluconolactonase/LRE family protein [Shewanella woodyi]|uniref:SMP-30/Gluconolaconase/LRE domain protein n=1 Tax=Shewanella woodyi (strain ATCC 51908 / MS32) TaxID=392500 RepID=B1KD91_SHEWM|nr:SMP-30/gluconolactonase/LRE family protein [Shewanella woodyi]ACA87926.1 SMP-30/Gluconolaconase/LRE domain protein [Shewanella woodyi ATCC 51908]